VKLVGLGAALVLFVAPCARASTDITYSLDDLDPLVGQGFGTGSVTGTITTDGTTATSPTYLSLSNIIGWHLNITIGGSSSILDPSNSEILSPSGVTGLSATESDLYFNYTAYIGLLGTSNFFEFYDPTGTNAYLYFVGGDGSGYLQAYTPAPAFTDKIGNEPIAEVATTPLPAALPMFSAGLGLVGWLARRKKRKTVTVLAAT
jgi:hypothetical protein